MAGRALEGRAAVVLAEEERWQARGRCGRRLLAPSFGMVTEFCTLQRPLHRSGSPLARPLLHGALRALFAQCNLATWLHRLSRRLLFPTWWRTCRTHFLNAEPPFAACADRALACPWPERCVSGTSGASRRIWVSAGCGQFWRGISFPSTPALAGAPMGQRPRPVLENSTSSRSEGRCALPSPLRRPRPRLLCS